MSKTAQREKTTAEAISFDPSSFLAKNLAIIAAVLYAAGWVYLNSYFAFFGVDLNQLDLSWNDVLVYSLIAGRHIAVYLAGPFLLTAAAIACVLYFRKYILNVDPMPTWTMRASLTSQASALAIGLALFVTIVASAHAVGQQLATRAWTSSRHEIIFNFKDECATDHVLTNLNEGGRLLMLKSTGKYYFVFARTGESRKEEIMHMRWFKIPVECTRYTQGTIVRPLHGKSER